MALIPGTRLGVYEVTAQIGAGGMGEVYRATDSNLKRSVAIKVLPAAVGGDADRLARFQREAEVLAALNHPNIGAIYGLEKTPAFTGLIMELVDGEDLSQRIGRGAIPLDEALPIAKQIADALEAAHEQGIIHRDLKPANIKVREDGTVKVLDFGLAKLVEAPAAGSSAAGLSQSPTITSPAMMTGVGVLLGTAAYMSPEQARGRVVDKRADIWAFGCVLYEMLTGTRAFPGDDLSETLAAVIKSEPDWSKLPAPTPTSIRRLLRRCLDKDRKRRLADMGDARFEIEDALTRPVPDAMSVTQAPAVSPVVPPWRRSLPWGVASLLLVGLGFLSVIHFRETPPIRSPEIRAEIVTPTTSDPISFALSPDGRQLVFVASGDGPSRLWVRSLAETAARPLPGTEGAMYPFWSPDSRSVGFLAGTQLNRVDLSGGAPQALTKKLLAGRGGTWNAEGVILFAPNLLSPLFRVSASGGEPVAITKLDTPQTSHGFPWFLPDDRHFLFYVTGAPETSGIYLGMLDTQEMTRLTAADTAGAYLPAGWLLWVSAGKLVTQRLDLERRALVGSPVTVADPVGSRFNKGAFSVSATGLVAYRSVGTGRQQLRWVDRTGKSMGPLGSPDETGLATPRVSPNGQHVAVSRTVQGNTDLWLLNGTGMSRFTFDPSVDRYPLWSSDGSRIVFSSINKGAWNFFVGVTSRPGIGTPLLEAPLAVDSVATDWSADDRFVVYMSRDPKTSWDLWMLPMAGDRKPQLFLKTTSGERSGQFSPDGRWVAYTSDEGGRSEIYVRPFAAGAAPSAQGHAPGVRAAEQWQVSTAGGIYSRWRRDGSELYYLAPDGQMMAVSIRSTGATLQPGTPVALFDAHIYGGGADVQLGMQYDVTRDGRFLINTVLDDAAAPITLLQNWAPRLSQ